MSRIWMPGRDRDHRADRHGMNRRHFLRGAGGAAIALPFLLSESGDLRAQSAPPVERFIGFFLPLGLPKAVLSAGLDGSPNYPVNPVAPLKPYAAKLAMLKNVDVVNTVTGVETLHGTGSFSFLCAEDSTLLSTKGGPTLDWVIKQESSTQTPLPTLNTGIWGGDNAVERGRIVHSWRGKGQPNDPIADTLDLFKYIFGTPAMGATEDAAAKKKLRYRGSVLDNVLEDFKSATSDASGYGVNTRRLITQHADTVRDLERQVQALTDGSLGCPAPAAPPSVGGNGVEPSDFDRWDKNWAIMTDLYVLALRCDLVRTGTIMVGSGGDSFAYHGPGGSIADVHQDMDHQWNELSPANTKLWLESRAYLYSKVAELLGKLDDPSYHDTNGGTLLDNTTVLVGTELGDPLHDLKDLTYFLAGGRNRFKRGVIDLQGHNDVELYTTILKGIGSKKTLGNQTRFQAEVPILA